MQIIFMLCTKQIEFTVCPGHETSLMVSLNSISNFKEFTK